MFVQERTRLRLPHKETPQVVFDPPSAFRDLDAKAKMEFYTAETQKSEEKPVFSTRAHVFQIDPETKKSWLPCSKQAIPVMFYYDPNKETHRIISVDGSKAVINSTILPNMTFTKTSQKFGQWSDGRANTVFGLGFSSEVELNKFAEKFKEVKGATRSSSAMSNSSATAINSVNTNGPSNGSMNGMSDSPMSTPSVGHKPASRKSGSSASSGEEDMKEASGVYSHKPTGNTESQLKYENDRLKMALAQSSSNAKKWETELQTLKNNNARLTAALQESTTNVEEWKKQLNAYKEENSRLRRKVQELESSDQYEERFSAIQQEKLTLDGRLIQLESMLRQREEDIASLRQSNVSLTNENQTLQLESEKLQLKTEELTAQMSEASLNRLKVLTEIQQALADKIQEMSSLNSQLAVNLETKPPVADSS